MDTIKKRRLRRRNLGLSVIFILVITLGLTVFYVINKKNDFSEISDVEADYHTIEYNGQTYKYNTSIISLLALGIDNNIDDPEDATLQGQSDVMELILFDRENKRIELVGLQRDTMTEIEYTYLSRDQSAGWNVDHLCLAYANGHGEQSGCMHAMQAVSRMLYNVPVVHYASMNLNYLTQVHEIVGTLDITLPDNTLKSYDASWTKGATVTLTSSNVEKYLRTRDITVDGSAETRMERHRLYFDAYYKKLYEMLETDFNGTVSKLYSLVQNVTTNVSYEDLVSFANYTLEYDFDIASSYYTLPGKGVYGGEYDEYILDNDALKGMVVKLFYKAKGND
ncbi:MAG: LCP family protein [Erysipelotrichaceae bacterium]|nr:LCP family protein [Erysipelotrichaceae bacterium]